MPKEEIIAEIRKWHGNHNENSQHPYCEIYQALKANKSFHQLIKITREVNPKLLEKFGIFCPFCGETIDELIEWANELVPYVVKVAKGVLDFEPDHKREPEYIHDSVSDYSCPECGETICEGIQEAKKFLGAER